VIFSVVTISLLRKAIIFVKYWVSVLCGDGQEVVNFCQTSVWPGCVE
jgi:hypothetical protein